MTKKDLKLIFLPVICVVLLLFSFFCTLKPTTVYANATTNIITLTNTGQLNKITFLNDCIYAIDTTNEQIIKYDTATDATTKFGGVYDINNRDTTFVDLNNYCVTSTGEFFVSEPTAGIKEYTSQFELKNEYEVISDGLNSTFIQIIADMMCDFQDNLYALEYGQTTQILLKQHTSQNFTIYSTIDLETSSSAQLLVSYNGDSIFILDANKLYKVSGNNTSLVLELDSSSVILDIAIDYKNNIYLLTSSNYLQRYEFQVSNSQYILSESLQLQKAYSSFILNYETGKTYYTVGSSIEIIENQNNFIHCLNTYTHPTDYSQLSALTTAPKIAKLTTANAIVYKQPIDIINIDTLSQNDEFIILSDNLIDAPNYAYILTSKDIEGQQIMLAGYILKNTYAVLSASQISNYTNPVTSNNNVKVFKYPSTAFCQTDEQTYSKLYLQTLTKGESITIIDNASNYHDANDLTFYKILLNDGIGYILRSSVCEKYVEEVSTLLSPNAQIKLPKGAKTAKVYNDCYESVEISQIQNNCLVHSFENSLKNGYIKIEYIDPTSNEIISGYIKADYITNLGTSMYIVLGIGLLLIAILIVLIIIYCNIKRKRKNQEHNQEEQEENQEEYIN